MTIRKIRHIVSIFLLLFVTNAVAGNVFIYTGHGINKNKHSNRFHRNNTHHSHNRSYGLVPSFSNSYGPVTALGSLNNYHRKKSNLFNRRYSYDENFNIYLRNKAIKESHHNKGNRHFGLSKQHKKNNAHKNGHKNSHHATGKPKPRIFTFKH